MRRRPFFGTVLIGKSVLIREGIAGILRAAHFRIVGSVASPDDLPPSKLQPHEVLVLIVHTGDDFDVVVEQVELLRDRHPKVRIAIVADHYRLGEMVSAFRAGANGYFVDVKACDVFIKSVELVTMGETIFPPAFTSFILDSGSDYLGKVGPCSKDNQAILVPTEDRVTQQLSPREKSILRCLIAGDSNKSIARKIDIAEATVKVHVKAILRKIRVQNRTQAAIWGMNNVSLVPPANNESPTSIGETSGRLPNALNMVPDVKQIEAPEPLEAIDHQTNHVEVSNVTRLMRKSVSRQMERRVK
jgi:DNA-binding NarL/FixJ family response regulator